MLCWLDATLFARKPTRGNFGVTFSGGKTAHEGCLQKKGRCPIFCRLQQLPKKIRKAEIEVLVGSQDHPPPKKIPKLQADGSVRTSNDKNAGGQSWLVGVLKSSAFEAPLSHKIDPWELRRDFLALDGSTDGLAAFLNRYGSGDRMYSPRFTPGKKGFILKPVIVLPVGIWNEREEIKLGLAAGASSWFSSYKPVHEFNVRPEFPHYYHRVTLCVGAIEMAATIDFLRQVKFRICPRVDCGQPFPVERKGKIYCSQYCAHLVSLRKTRKKQQAMRRKEK